MAKETATAKMEETRKRGRPCKRQTDKVEDDLSIIEIKNTQAVAKDCQEWRKVVLEAMVHNRL
jgi:hypothetical protein